MNKFILLFVGILMFASCSNDSIVPEEVEISTTNPDVLARQGNKVDVCHKGEIINVSVNSLSAHQGHGDAVDMDGDGYFDIENSCSEIDLDDTKSFDQSTLTDADEDGYFTTYNPFSDIDCDDYSYSEVNLCGCNVPGCMYD